MTSLTASVDQLTEATEKIEKAAEAVEKQLDYSKNHLKKIIQENSFLDYLRGLYEKREIPQIPFKSHD